MIIILLITYFCILCVLTISCKEIPFRPSHNHSHKKHITWISFMIATCVYHAWRLLVDNAYHFLRYIRGEILYCRTVFVQCQSSMRLYFDTPSNIISSLLVIFLLFSCVPSTSASSSIMTVTIEVYLGLPLFELLWYLSTWPDPWWIRAPSLLPSLDFLLLQRGHRKEFLILMSRLVESPTSLVLPPHQ